jgi:hypothetical protein
MHDHVYAEYLIQSIPVENWQYIIMTLKYAISTQEELLMVWIESMSDKPQDE